MNNVFRPIFGMLAALLAVGCHHSDKKEPCQVVNAVLHSRLDPSDCASPIGSCTRGHVEGGVLTGTTYYVTSAMLPAASLPGDDSKAFSYAGSLAITTKEGALVLVDRGVLDLRPGGHLSQYETPISGTGVFVNVTGSLFINGFLTADGKGFDSTITGKLCNK